MATSGPSKTNSHVEDTVSAFKLALAQREFEITQLTNRNNFFMVFQGVLLAGLVQSQGAAPAVLNFLVCVAGMAMSLFQAGMAGGAKYWQIRWEVAVKHFELQLLEENKNQQILMQMFTSDNKHLSDLEIDRIKKINIYRQANGHGLVGQESGFLDGLVKEDLLKKSFSFGPNAQSFWLDKLIFIFKNILKTIAKNILRRRPVIWFIPKSYYLKEDVLIRSFLPVNFFILRRFSVSKIPVRVGITLFFVWMALWLNTFAYNGESAWALTIGKISEKITFAQFVPPKKEEAK